MTVIAAPPSPYKGLAAFEASEVDALFFFGRDRDSDVIAANLMAARLTVLFGPTGVGKTSVLRAGVAYRLEHEPGVEVLIHSTWTEDPIAGIVAVSGRDEATISQALSALATDIDGDVYLILDQFDEYFLYHQDDRALFDVLAELLADSTLRVNVLIGIREDALAQLDAFRAIIPNLLSNRLRLDRLDRAAGRDAILGPVARYNELVDADAVMQVEPPLVESVLEEVAAGRVDLGGVGLGVVNGRANADRIEAPYLQLVMSRLWEIERDRGSNVLRDQTLRELGGAAQIVHDHLEHAMAELSPRQKDAAAAMYNFLVTPSGSKIAHGVGDLAGYADLDEAEAAEVLRLLAAERIVRANAENGSATRYEIFHDVLADAVAAWRTRYRSERAIHEAERRRRRAFAVATAALVGLLLVAAIAIFALVERRHSRAEAKRAHARELAAGAHSRLETNPRQSVRMAVEAAQLEPRFEEEQVLREALMVDAQRSLLRAGGPVRVAEFAPSGRRFATGSKDGLIRIYRLGQSEPIRVLEQGGPVTAAVYASSGDLLTAGRDGTAKLWTPEGSLQHTLAAGGPVTSASFGRGKQMALTLTENGFIRVWQTADGKLLRTIRVSATKALPKNGELDPLAERIATVGHDRFARVYSVRTGRLVQKLRHAGLVHCARFSPDGSLLLTCGHEGVLRLWSRSGQLIRELRGPQPNQAILDGAFSPKGLIVAAAVSDGTARTWETRTGLPIATMFAHLKPVGHIGFSPAGNALVTAAADGQARTWLATGKAEFTLIGHTGVVNAAAFSPDSRWIVTAGEDRTARIWASGTKPELTLVARQATITSFAVSKDGKRVLVGDGHGVARLRTVSGAHVLTTIRGAAPVTAVAFTPRGPIAASLPTLSLGVSHDGRHIARGRADGTVLIRGPDGGRLLRTGGAGVTAVAFSQDDRSLATGDDRGALRLWDVESLTPTRGFPGQRLRITSVAFSPDDKLLLTASRDREAMTWNIATGRAEQVLGLHFGPVADASFSADGRWAVTAGASDATIVRVETGQRLIILHGHSRPLIGAAFVGDDGLTVLTASKDGTIRQYHCDICGGVDALLQLAKRRLAPG
jgi:WD40 repeat protein